MTRETHVTVMLDSAAVFQALREQRGDWRMSEHTFDPNVDEVTVSYDSGGSGRVGITIGFELTEDEMARLMKASRPSA